MFACSIDVNEESLREFAKATGKTPKDAVEILVNQALVYFLSGKTVGLEQGRDAALKAIDNVFPSSKPV